MNYRTKAINCVKDTVLPVQMAQFRECGCSLDEQYRKYGDTEGFFAKTVEPGRRYEMGYPKCVARRRRTGKRQTLRTANVPDKAYCISCKPCCRGSGFLWRRWKRF